MRLFLDLQSIQGESGARGIGRYSFHFARALVQGGGQHEIWLGLTDRLPIPWDKVAAIRGDSIPRDRVVTIAMLPQCAEMDPANHARARANEKIREAAIANLRPDIVHVGSLFEGYTEDKATSVAAFESGLRTAVTLYDLIPLIGRDQYLRNGPVRDWYMRKIESLKNAAGLLAISESAKREAVEHLRIPAERVGVVHPGVDTRFWAARAAVDRDGLRSTFGLEKPFLMYTGGDDARKNVERLVEAFARLSPAVREKRQLVILTAHGTSSHRAIVERTRRLGLAERQVVLPGIVSDDDLRLLYQAAELFVFPSLHEGFGLPILEAMACGTPVIASNSSGMPEIVVRRDALFDPANPASIAAKIEEVLSTPALLQGLSENSALQARRFSWQRSAEQAWRAFEAIVLAPKASSPARRRSKPKLAYFSPLPPVRSGISDYSAELLPALARHYEIDAIVDQDGVDDQWIAGNIPLRKPSWFAEHAHEFDRVVYNVGNSAFHEYMLEPATSRPGVVILHDVFISNLVRYLGGKLGSSEWSRRLYAAHGISALRRFPTMAESESGAKIFPLNLPVVEHATGVIVHSAHAIDLVRSFLREDSGAAITRVPFARRLGGARDRSAARQGLGIQADETLVCSFGRLAPVKLAHRLVEVWRRHGLADRPKLRLVFVGDLPQRSPYHQELRKAIGEAERIQVTGHVEPPVYQAYLAACDLAVQLRTGSRGETSASAHDCLANGVPLIVNAHGSMAEMPDDVVFKIPDDFADAQLADALTTLIDSPERRPPLGKKGLDFSRAHHDPEEVAKLIRDAVEMFAVDSPNGRMARLAREITDPAGGLVGSDLVQSSIVLSSNAKTVRPRQILLDVSELSRTDRKTGIERVAGNLVDHLTQLDRHERMELVTAGVEVRYARSFAARRLGLPAFGPDRPVMMSSGDRFLGLEINAAMSPDLFETFRRRNVESCFVIYDILPVTHPNFFLPSILPTFARWLNAIVTHADAVVCISRSVADALHVWLEEVRPSRLSPLKIGVFSLGADFGGTSLTEKPSVEAEAVINALRGRKSVLMVGTIEPRKGHDQALAGFEQLWKRGSDTSLVIVGKAGWMTETLTRRIRAHPEHGKRLFWLEGATDADLALLYKSADLFLACSWAEGFGLPLVEAARHGLPILARDIPVFREVGAPDTGFFAGEDGAALGDTIHEVLSSARRTADPAAHSALTTWRESARQLLSVIEGNFWYRVWPG